MRELQGQPGISLEDQSAPNKEIAFARSFGWAVTELADLEAAATRFVSGTSSTAR